MTTSLDVNAIESIVKIARQSGPVLTTASSTEDDVGLPKQIPVALNPIDGNVTTLHGAFERYRLFPARKMGTAVVTSLESFKELTNRHKTEHSAVFADTSWRKPSLETVIDYHKNESQGLADNLEHRIKYEFPFSDDWKKWTSTHGTIMNQTAFAEFVEDNIQDFVSMPEDFKLHAGLAALGYVIGSPADLVTFSRGVIVTNAATYAIKQKLTNGNFELGKKDETSTQTTKGEHVSIPELLLLNIATFDNDEPRHMLVRLRTRNTGNGLVWSFLLFRPDLHIAEILKDAIADVQEKTKLPIFAGSPERPF